MKSTSYTSTQKVACGECTSDVIICVDPLTTISGLSGIDGQIVSFNQGTNCQGCHYYVYGITYEEGQLLDPDAEITILGIVCKGCLTDYFTGLINTTIAFAPYFDTRNTSVASFGLTPGTVTTGTDNTAIGFAALAADTSGNSNSAVGSLALTNITTGSDNVALGRDAGRHISGGVVANETSGTSIYLGVSTQALADGDSNEIVIGANVTGLGTNTTVIGSGTTTLTALRGQLGVNGILAPTAHIHLPAGSAAVGTAPIKLTSGPLLGAAEAGTIQFLGDAFYGGITTGPATKQFVFTDGSITGNAATATALQTPRNINGVAFDGTADIVVPSDIAPGAAGNVMTSTGAVWSSAPIAGTGTVTSVSVTTANGVSGIVATPTTTPAISLTLGNINPTSVNGLVFTNNAVGFDITGGVTSKTLTVPLDASVSGTNTGDQDLAAVTAVGATTTTAVTLAALSLGYVAKVADYGLGNSDYTVECTANSFNITLPTAVGITGRIYNIKDTGVGVITILTTGGETVDGQASGFWQLTQWVNMQVQSNGANWIIL